MTAKDFRAAAHLAGYTIGKHRGQEKYTVGTDGGGYFIVTGPEIECASTFDVIVKAHPLIGRQEGELR